MYLHILYFFFVIKILFLVFVIVYDLFYTECGFSRFGVYVTAVGNGIYLDGYKYKGNNISQYKMPKKFNNNFLENNSLAHEIVIYTNIIHFQNSNG